MTVPAGNRWPRLRCAALIAAALLPSGALRADYVPLAGRLGVVAERVETQLERNARCTARVPVLEQRILQLQADPVANAQAIAEAGARLVSVRDCVGDSLSRSSSLELRLAGLAAQFLQGTGADSADLQQQLAGLRVLEADHARVAASLRVAQDRLELLRQNPEVSAVLVAQKTAVVASLRAELDALLAGIANKRQQLVQLENAQLAANRTGSASLTWSVPTTRVNGTPLAPGELGGYEIYVLSESTGTSTIITVGDPLATRYTVDGLTPDTYHFSIAAYDSTGKVSELSAIVTKTVL